MHEARDSTRRGYSADFSFSTADVSLLHSDMAADGQAIISSDHALLDLCVTPRPVNMRGSFAGTWDGHRFEPLGDIIFVPPGYPLHLRWDGNGEQYSIRCELRGKLARHRFRNRMDWTEARLLASLDISSHSVRLLLRRLAEEARSPRRDTRLLVGAIATQLTVELSRYLEFVTDNMAHGGLSAWRLRLIDERLEKETVPPTLVELAGLCSISVRQLTRGFLKSRGCTLGQYVHQSRIDAVKRLLATQESIKSVADAVGFSSTSSLAQAFRRSTGLTPRSYQQRIWRSSGSGHS
ncbi:AraC family transcriptional regulator [Sphingobium yanoikuyae]|nr:helix-turn-helix domain-containing protein [Sphingobium yanoikuyae]